jgi:C4-dicarboxylate transporter DctM subunit
MNSALIFALLIVLMLTGMPISISLGLTVLTFLFTMTDVPVQAVALKLFTGIEKFEIMAIPFFILAGNFLTHGGVARRMIRFASSMIGHWHGGLGLAGVMACALFAAVSGSSPATVVAIGSVILPAMIKQGFPPRFGAGILTTSGSLGILIPPSIAMVMYSVSTNVSVGAMFIAGIVPGIVLAFLLGLTTWHIARKNNHPRMPKASAAERWLAFRESVWGLALIVVVMGGIYSGVFTPTEAAAMAAVYAFLVACFVYKDMPLRKVPKVLLDSASMSAMLLYIITNAVLFSFLMTSENIPQSMADWMIYQGFGTVAFLLVVNVLLLLAGNVMEPSSIILILAPILFPVAIKLGIDPIHFGILIVVNMEVGMCHPPVGLNLYVASGITRMGISELTVAVLPWLLTMLGFLAAVTYWPALTLWLPHLLMK